MNAVQLFFVVLVLIAALSVTQLIRYSKQSNAQKQINITELDTLDWMWYTAIQMSVLDSQTAQVIDLQL